MVDSMLLIVCDIFKGIENYPVPREVPSKHPPPSLRVSKRESLPLVLCCCHLLCCCQHFSGQFHCLVAARLWTLQFSSFWEQRKTMMISFPPLELRTEVSSAKSMMMVVWVTRPFVPFQLTT